MNSLTIIRMSIIGISIIGMSIIGMWNVKIKEFNDVLPLTINISDKGNFGIHMTHDDRIFNFGTMFPGAITQKTMILERGKDPPARINISVSGDIKNWTSVDKNDFILDKMTEVNITVSIPDNAEKRVYNGNVTISYISTYGVIFEDHLKKLKGELII